MLYEIEITGDDGSEILERRRVSLSDYAVDLVVGVGEGQDRIDEALARHLRGWDLDRLAVVDRTLARMAAWELTERPEVPVGAVMSELVELATQYCSAESPRFLNGLLSAVAKNPEADDRPPTAALPVIICDLRLSRGSLILR